jgi:paraquat-inducible protein A
MAAADSVLDREAVWNTLEGKGVLAGWTEEPATHCHDSNRLIGCNSCGLVSQARMTCPCCGAIMRPRKTDSLRRTWALLLTAAMLYVPANTMPILTLVEVGHSGTPSTLLRGIRDIATSGYWPLAVLVFFASIIVPLFKLLGLSALLITTQRGMPGWLRERTLIYRVVDSIGRWSAVVVLTMLAAHSFDSRLMWDAAMRNKRPGQATR